MESYHFLGLPQSQWQFINTFANWLSAIGTLAAVIVSLRLAYNATTPRAKVTASVYLAFDGYGSDPDEAYGITIVNTGDRPITVNGIGWRVGIFRRRFAIQMTDTDGPMHSTPLPASLSHGQSAHW